MPEANMIYDTSNPLTAIQASVAQNNAWSAEQAQKQMDFQREMSNTAHQREVADLKAAGLNPVLSARLGGASTPSGAMAQGDTSGTSTLVDLLMMSMETANAAAGAARAAAASSSTDKSIGLPTFKNPKTWLELAYNFAAQKINENITEQEVSDFFGKSKHPWLDPDGAVDTNIGNQLLKNPGLVASMLTGLSSGNPLLNSAKTASSGKSSGTSSNSKKNDNTRGSQTTSFPWWSFAAVPFIPGSREPWIATIK